MEREYSYKMGFRINDTPVPDPSAFSGAESDLDTLGKRDSTGELHRNKVAQKFHQKMEWNNLGWDMIQRIGNLMNQSDRFQWTYPEPMVGMNTVTAYCGDREWEAKKCYSDYMGDWVGTLKVSIIQI